MENSLKNKKIADSQSTVPDNRWYFFTLFYFVMDYGRPQDIMPIGFLRPAMIVILILSYYIFSAKKFDRYVNKQIKLILMFSILLALHIPFARNNFFAWITFKTMLLYMPIILSVIATINSIDRLKRLVLVLQLIMLYVCMYSITHKGLGSGNYFADENDLSLYINMYLPLSYFLFIYNKRIKMKMFYLFSVAIGLIAIVVSFSRGGFIGLLAIGFVIWLISPKKVLSIFVIALIGCVFYFSVSDRYLSEMKTSTDAEHGTGRDRVESWKSGWNMFLDNPLGVGGNNYQVRFPEYQTAYFTKGMWGRAAHSLWFTLIPELGIPGILIYFALLYYNLKDIFFLRKLKKDNNNDKQIEYLYVLSLAVLASFAGYFASGSFISVLYYAHYWYMCGILIAMVNVAKNLYKTNLSQA